MLKTLLTIIISAICVCISIKSTINQLNLFNEKLFEIYVKKDEPLECKIMIKKQVMYIFDLGLCIVALTYLN